MHRAVESDTLRYETESSTFSDDSLNYETYKLDDYSHARCLGEVTYQNAV